jgi:hypothetical protein
MLVQVGAVMQMVPRALSGVPVCSNEWNRGTGWAEWNRGTGVCQTWCANTQGKSWTVSATHLRLTGNSHTSAPSDDAKKHVLSGHTYVVTARLIAATTSEPVDVCVCVCVCVCECMYVCVCVCVCV